MRLLEAILRHDRWIVLAGLAAIAGSGWAFLWDGAGMGMPAAEMSAALLFPHLQPPVGGEMASGFAVLAFMWWSMMVAMMMPSAAPLALLHGRVLQRSGQSALAPGLLLLAGYFSAWLLFSLAAAGMQLALQSAGLISSMMLWSRSEVLSAALLAAAGAYQLSAAKRACLSGCRSPARFLTEHWRPGAAGAFALGLRHGAFCVGCCWHLMALLFVVGVMNLWWIAALMAIVLLERLLPARWEAPRAIGVLLLLWSAATLVA